MKKKTFSPSMSPESVKKDLSTGFVISYNQLIQTAPIRKKDTRKNKKRICDTLDSSTFFNEANFLELLLLESRRTYRSGRPFLLISIDVSKITNPKKGSIKKIDNRKIDNLYIVDKLIRKLQSTTREIDIKGWLRQNCVIGIICTDIKKSYHINVVAKVRQKLIQTLGMDYSTGITIKWRSFPAEGPSENDTKLIVLEELEDDTENEKTHEISMKKLTDDPHKEATSVPVLRKSAIITKRIMDILGSLFGIILFSPFFTLIPVLIKLTSKGPVLFKQERVGLDGKRFQFLKFRSMYANNDNAIHEEFITKLIRNEIQSDEDEKKNAYKMENDPRITKFGKILRKTSLDEIPQFFNVIKGEMSLVGPRPPIPYEVDKYDNWHTRRVLHTRPGITGFWQVKGRSSTTFNDMVRMDLQYIKNWSLWLDIKLLLKTVQAVFASKGAC